MIASRISDQRDSKEGPEGQKSKENEREGESDMQEWRLEIKKTGVKGEEGTKIHKNTQKYTQMAKRQDKENSKLKDIKT